MCLRPSGNSVRLICRYDLLLKSLVNVNEYMTSHIFKGLKTWAHNNNVFLKLNTTLVKKCFLI